MSPSRSPTPTLVNHLSNSLIHSSSTTPSRHPHSSSSSAPPHPSSFDETSPSRPYPAAERRSRPPPLTIASPRPSAHGPPLQATSLSSTTATAPPPLSGPTSVETKLPDSIATTTTSTIANPSSSSKRKAVVLTTAAPVETPTTANSTTTLTDNNSYYDYCSPTMAKRIRRRSPSPRRPPSTTPTAATTTTTTATFFSSSTSPSSFRRRRRDGSSSGAMGGGGDCSSPSSSSQDGMMADTDSDVGKTEDTADHLSLSNVTSSADGGGVRQSQAATTHATTATPSTTSSSLSLAGGGGPPGMEGATTTAPPKKKRTRTLTTPHQSAVLHALLAQSRFPTTAMREEVGRSIGLSARKVQIWFQNQRQKARRPRSQGDTAAAAVAARPPQYGPFPTAPDPGLVQTQTSRGFHESSTEHSTRSIQELGSRETPPRLLGPGMPGVGAAPYPPQPYRTQGHGVPVSAPPIESSHFPPGPSVHRPVSPLIYGSPRMYPPPAPRPATSHPGNAWRERDPSRTLPPLIPSRPPSSSNHASRLPPPHGSLPHRHAPSPRLPHPSGAVLYPHPRTLSHSQPLPSPLLPPYDPITRSTSPEPRFAHHPPEGPARSHHSTAIPPPFTLQPPPQWDDTSFSPFPRPTSSGWSRPRSRTMGGRSTSPAPQTYRTGPGERMGSGSSISDLSPSEGRHAHSLRHGLPPTPTSHYGASAMTTSPQSMTSSSSGPPSRSGRYDPVRATFVPYSSPSPTVSPSHAVGHGHSTASGVGRSRGGNGDDNQKSHHHER